MIGEATHALVNLEGPLTDSAHRIMKTGPAIASSPMAGPHLREAGFTGVTMANNHIMDAGVAGLIDTVAQCEEVGLEICGLEPGSVAGNTLGPLNLHLEERPPVRILNYCEEEWVVFGGVGARTWSLHRAIRDVMAAKNEGLRCVVVIHGGNEFFPLPRPVLRDELRLLADLGADAIVMHHNHVASAYEVWNGTPIFYGIGNFQFTMQNPDLGWYEGLIVKLSFGEHGVAHEVVPIRMTEAYEVDVAEPEGDPILNRVEGHCVTVASDEALSAAWNEFAVRTGGSLAAALSSPPRGRIGGRLVAVKEAIKPASAEGDNLLLANVLQCDSLRQALHFSLRESMDNRI
jgi:hypothetical protein